MPNHFFNHPGITASSLTRNAVHVRLTMEELSGLRKLKIRFVHAWRFGLECVGPKASVSIPRVHISNFEPYLESQDVSWECSISRRVPRLATTTFQTSKTDHEKSSSFRSACEKREGLQGPDCQIGGPIPLP